MLITAPHPQFCFYRNPYEWGTFTNYLNRFARAVNGKLRTIPDLDEGALITIPTVDHVAQLAREPWVAVDIETLPANTKEPWTGKDPTRARLRCIGIGTCTWALTYKWNGETPVKAAIKALLNNPDVIKVLMNGEYFDIPVLRRYKIPVVNTLDIRDMRRVVVSTSRLSLAYQASLYCDSRPWKSNEVDEAEDKNK